MKMKRPPLQTPWHAPRRREPVAPALRFTPYAWAKLLFLRDRGGTEIGGFGVASTHDPLLVEDLVLVKQACTAVSVDFLDEAVAAFFEEQADLGRRPESFARVWVHTHPGESASPSAKDEATFEAAFGRCNWAVMAILAKGGEAYAKLRFPLGPQAIERELGVRVAYDAAFTGADPGGWAAEYAAAVTIDAHDLPWGADPRDDASGGGGGYDDFLERLELSDEGIALLGGVDQLDLREEAPRGGR